MRIIGIDYSYSKSGVAVVDINEDTGECKLVFACLLISLKYLDFIERTSDHVSDIEKLIKEYKPDLVVKEGAIMGRSSTGIPVLKAHGVLEYKFFINDTPLEEVHNMSIKAWARKQLIESEGYTKESIKELNKKEIVALAIESYHGYTIEEIRTPRGRLLDDVADAIAIPIVYYEKNLK